MNHAIPYSCMHGNTNTTELHRITCCAGTNIVVTTSTQNIVELSVGNGSSLIEQIFVFSTSILAVAPFKQYKFSKRILLGLVINHYQFVILQRVQIFSFNSRCSVEDVECNNCYVNCIAAEMTSRRIQIQFKKSRLPFFSFQIVLHGLLIRSVLFVVLTLLTSKRLNGKIKTKL